MLFIRMQVRQGAGLTSMLMVSKYVISYGMWKNVVKVPHGGRSLLLFALQSFLC